LRIVIRRVATVVAVGLVLAACGSDTSGDAVTDTVTDTTAASAATVPEDSGGVVPDDAPAILQFSAPLIGGGDIELTTLAGRPVLLWFWAPW
jgi:hypothetical protein